MNGTSFLNKVLWTLLQPASLQVKNIDKENIVNIYGVVLLLVKISILNIVLKRKIIINTSVVISPKNSKKVSVLDILNKGQGFKIVLDIKGI